jgi:pyridoxal 5'-phosphate synthase subunit Pdx1
MAKARIGHFVEARILQAIGVDYIDESEVLTPADPEHHINKHAFKVPFVCGAKNLGEALRRISEGAAMIRTKGEAGTGNVIEVSRSNYFSLVSPILTHTTFFCSSHRLFATNEQSLLISVELQSCQTKSYIPLPKNYPLLTICSRKSPGPSVYQSSTLLQVESPPRRMLHS